MRLFVPAPPLPIRLAHPRGELVRGWPSFGIDAPVIALERARVLLERIEHSRIFNIKRAERRYCGRGRGANTVRGCNLGRVKRRPGNWVVTEDIFTRPIFLPLLGRENDTRSMERHPYPSLAVNGMRLYSGLFLLVSRSY